jgi:hypothetical protein
LTDYPRASPTPLFGNARAYRLVGTFWTTPTDAAPSCITVDRQKEQGNPSKLPSRPAYDLGSVPRESLLYGSGNLPGFPQLYSDVPYIAQCTGAAFKGVPYALKKASFLTVTQTVSNGGAAQTPAATTMTSAQPEKRPNEPLAASSALAPEKSQALVVPASSVPQVPQISPVLAPAPSQVAPSQLAPPVIPLPGTTLTANSVSKYVVGTQTLIPGGSAISISGTAVSLVPSATALVIGGSSTMNIVLTPATQAPQPPAITLAGTTLTANSASQYVVGTQTMIPGGPAITVLGTVVALAPSATAIILGGSNTINLTPPSSPSGYNPLGPSISATPTEIPIVVIDGQTLILTPDSSTTGPVIAENVPFQVSGSYVIYRTSTIPFSEITTAIPDALVYTSMASAMVIGSQTLLQGGSAVTLEAGAGTTMIVSWGTSEASAVVISQGPGGTSTAEERRGGSTTQGSGGIRDGNPTARPTASVAMYTGGASSLRGEDHSYVFWGIGLVMAFLEIMV